MKSKDVPAGMQVLTKKDFDNLPEVVENPKAFSQWVRQLQQNWRQATAAVKGRSEVSFSSKKPWKQKGTGRARAGTARSPLWRGGGVIFGPQPQVRKLKVSKQLKSGVLQSLLNQMLKGEGVMLLDWHLKDAKPKTALAFEALKKSGLLDERVLVLLPADDVQHHLSFLNIPNVRVTFFDQLNAYDLANATKWIVLKKDLETFKEVVSTWI